MQLLMLLSAFLVIFLVLFSTRDIILRSNSFLLQVVCILLVAALPVIGFLIYLLIRPSRTLAQRGLEKQVEDLLSRLQGTKKEGKGTTGSKGGTGGKTPAAKS
jgi:hypothetical protein